jgi:deoxycytidine triphosphate deaminase
MSEDQNIRCHFCKPVTPGEETTCTGYSHRAGILTDYEIIQYELIKDIIRNADGNILHEGKPPSEYLKGTSYNLRLGEGHYVFTKDENKGQGGWSRVWISPFGVHLEQSNRINPTFVQKDYLRIEPFSSALIQLKETVDTRTCVEKNDLLICGRFDLRLTMVTKGLISQQATQVEPNYRGKLFCYLFNQTGDAIDLKYEEEIATIEFYYVSCAIHCNPEEKKSLLDKIDKNHKNNKYQYETGADKFETKVFCNEHGIDDVRYFGRKEDGDRQLPNHGGLFHFHNEFENQKKQLNTDFANLKLDHQELMAAVKPESLLGSAQELLKREIDAKLLVFGKLPQWIITAITVVVALIVLFFGNRVYVNNLDELKNKYSSSLETVKKDFEKKMDDELSKFSKELENLKSEKGKLQHEK